MFQDSHKSAELLFCSEEALKRQANISTVTKVKYFLLKIKIKRLFVDT